MESNEMHYSLRAAAILEEWCNMEKKAMESPATDFYSLAWHLKTIGIAPLEEQNQQYIHSLISNQPASPGQQFLLEHFNELFPILPSQ